MGTGGRLCETQVQNSVLPSPSCKALDKLLDHCNSISHLQNDTHLAVLSEEEQRQKNSSMGLGSCFLIKEKKKRKTTVAVLIIIGPPKSEDSEMKSSRPV